jgi:hypothetical protein
MLGKGLLVVLALSAASCMKAKSQAPPVSPETTVEQADHLVPNPTLPPRAYTDGLGIVVEIVPLKIPDGESPRALLRVTGIPNFIAGVTFVATRVTLNEREDIWQTPIDGRKSMLLHTPHSEGRNRLTLSMPRLRARFALEHDPGASAAIDVEELIADHRAHIADGSIAKIAAFDREYVESGKADQISERLALLSKACGKEIAASFDWQSVKTADDFNEVHFCAMSLEAITELCELSLSIQKDIAGKLNGVECRMQREEEFVYDKSRGVLSVNSHMDAMQYTLNAMKAVSSALDLHRTVLRSKSGLYLVLPVLQQGKKPLYAGYDRRLYAQSWSASTPGRHFSTWDGGRVAEVKLREPGLWTAKCKYGDVDFEEVAPAERDRVLADFSFEPKIWKRDLFALARDDFGIYYYVDRLNDRAGGAKGYRIFKGPRGKLALTKLVDIVDDSRGKIFSTTSGDLRLVLTGKGPVEARWITGKRERSLIVLKRFAALRFVYGDLGVYQGEELGSVCSLARGAANKK